MVDYKPVSEMTDEEILYWVNKPVETLNECLSWAGWGFPYSALPRVEANWWQRNNRYRAACDEAKKRGLR